MKSGIGHEAIGNIKKKYCGLALCAMLFAVLVPVEAQQWSKIPRIALVDSGSPKITGHRADAFVRGLKELGYVDGRHISIQYLWAEGKLERLPAFINEVIDGKVDVIVSSATPAIRIAQESNLELGKD